MFHFTCMSIFVFLSLILVLKRLKIKSTLCNNKKWVNGNHRYWSHSLIICTGSITSLIKKNTCKFKLNRTDSLSLPYSITRTRKHDEKSFLSVFNDTLFIIFIIDIIIIYSEKPEEEKRSISTKLFAISIRYLFHFS